MAESDMQRSNGEPEAVRRRDGGGETGALPGSETARGSEQTSNTPTGHREAETWTPGKGGDGAIRPGSPADAALAGTAPADGPKQPDEDPQAGGGKIPMPDESPKNQATGADAPSHNSR